MQKFQKFPYPALAFVFLAFLFSFPSFRLTSCNADVTTFQNQTINDSASSGRLRIIGVTINRMNLALKEFDLEIGILNFEANGPFNFSIWAPFRGGGPTYVGNGTPIDSSSWYEYRLSQWKWLRFVSLNTVGLWGINTFPFEAYRTEIIFGFSVSNVTPDVRDSYLSWELEQQGYWVAQAWATNTSSSEIAALNATHASRIEQYNLKSFISLFIQLSHPIGYIWKMVIPTWGPVVFTLIVLIAQFSILRKKMKRGDHISMFVAVSIFSLSTSFVIRETSPPELTFPEMLSFLIALCYSLLLFGTLYSRSHRNDEAGESKPISSKNKTLRNEDKRSLAFLFAGALIGFIKSILELPISGEGKGTLVIITTGAIILLLFYGIGVPQREYHEFILRRRWKKPLKIGIFNDLGEDTSNSEIFVWSDISPKKWKESIEELTKEMDIEVKVEPINVGMNFHKYVAILNPYGGVYPELDLRNLSTLDKILDYVKEGVCFLNVADIPSYWAYNPDLHRKLDIASTVHAAFQTPTGVGIVSTKPFETTPLIKRLGLRVMGAYVGNLGVPQNLNAVLGTRMRIGTIRSERLAIAESNVMSGVPVTELAYIDGRTYPMTGLFFDSFGEGFFLFSLLWINAKYHKKRAKQTIQRAIIKLLIEKIASMRALQNVAFLKKSKGVTVMPR